MRWMTRSGVARAVLLASVAGAAVSSVAHAQEFVQPGAIGSVFEITPDGEVLREVNVGQYASRAPDYTYNNWLFAGVAGSPGASVAALDNHYLEDVSFTPGPWANAAVRGVERLRFSVQRMQAVPQTATQLLYTFWDKDDVNYIGFAGAGQPMINPAAVALGQVRIGLPTINNNAINGFIVTGINPVVNLPAGENVFVEAALVNTGTNTLITTDHLRLVISNSSGLAGNAASIGTTAADLGYDANRNSIFIGNATINNATERRAYAFGAPTRAAGLDIAIGGEIPAVAPPCTALPIAADNAFAVANTSLGIDGVAWYCVDLTGRADAIDENNMYIDFDTETSANDAAIAIFSADGGLIASDLDSGSGVNAQLSFGMGRREKVSDGVDYDGRNFSTIPALSRGLAAGQYFVAVASGGATFASGFSATGLGIGGDVALRVRTNVTNGTLDSSVAPTATRIVGLSGEDPLVAPGGQGTQNLDGPGVVWYSFNLCQGSSSSMPVQFATAGTDALNSSVFVFDSAGNLAGQATGTDVAPPELTFMDLPALAAGEYYAAMTYSAPVDLSLDTTNAGRWHIRGRNGSRGYTFALQVIVPWTDCVTGCLVTCDYNQDGGADTADVIELADSIAAGTDPFPASCKDYNQDGGADTADIIDIADSIASGTCP